MLILEAGEVCPYGHRCPHNVNAIGTPCHGTLSSRSNKFTCDLVENGVIKDGFRVPGDQTGKMKVIID